MSPTDRVGPAAQQRPRIWLIVAAVILAMCLALGSWLLDYASKFEMFTKGREIADEMRDEVSRHGVRCSEDSMLLGSDEASDQGEPLRRIASFSLLRNDGPSLAAEARLTRIQPTAPWIEGVSEGEVIRLRLQCMQQRVVWCVETHGIRFHGPFLPQCPDSRPTFRQ